jgi:hypothetical protein
MRFDPNRNKAGLNPAPLNPQSSDFKSKPKVEPRKTSEAKALHIRLLKDKSSTFHLLTPEKAWESSEWFKCIPKIDSSATGKTSKVL